MPSATNKHFVLLLLVLLLATSLPQLFLCFERGSTWNGSYANFDMDEYAYSAYLNALMEGRARKNDPYTDNDANQPETVFSIQFAAPYFLLIIARLLHLSPSGMFILLIPVMTGAAAYSVFSLLAELTGNDRIASVGMISVLCFGTLVAFNPIEIWNAQAGFNAFPFLRRYTSALSFPLFIVTTHFVWRSLTQNWVWSVLAGLSFILLVFSYFFTWTITAAWFFFIAVLWLICKSEDWKIVGKVSIVILALGASALFPYAWLLSHRDPGMVRQQVLERTHSLDLFRGPECYGLLILFFLSYQLLRRVISYHDPRVLFTAAFALSPFFVFNQQIITGYSLQPFHYQHFIANYCVALAGFISIGLVPEYLTHRMLRYLALGSAFLSLMIGIRQAQSTNSISSNLDEGKAVGTYLSSRDRDGLVFASNFLLMDSLPTTTSNPILWSSHMSVFSTLEPEVQRKRFYASLYYIGLTMEDFRTVLHYSLVERAEIFGPARANPTLGSTSSAISEEEIANACRQYQAFADSFDETTARNPVLSYAAVYEGDNLTNLIRWYQLEELQRSGRITIYRLTLRK